VVRRSFSEGGRPRSTATQLNRRYRLVPIVALAVVIGAMEAGAASLMMLLREMFTVMLAQLGRLMFIGLCLLCLVLVLAAQLRGTGSH